MEKIEEYNHLQKDMYNLNELAKDNDTDGKIAEAELIEKNQIKDLNKLLKLLIQKMKMTLKIQF